MKGTKEIRQLDKAIEKDAPFADEHLWRMSHVDIPMPCSTKSFPGSEAGAPKIRVGGIRHRNLLEVIKTTLKDELASKMHWTPFKVFRKRPDGSPDKRIYSDIHTSDAMLEEYKKVQEKALVPDPDSDLIPKENMIFPIGLWLDSTMLAQFGDTSLWPLYMSALLLSKYIRGKPTKVTMQHVAYIPSVSFYVVVLIISNSILQLPKDFTEICKKAHGHQPSKAMYTHMKRELFHACWRLFLNEEFVTVYEKGFVHHCADGIVRRIFPQFKFYSADYPEKCALLLYVRTVLTFL